MGLTLERFGRWTLRDILDRIAAEREVTGVLDTWRLLWTSGGVTDTATWIQP